jgi:hypothetical protein
VQKIHIRIADDPRVVRGELHFPWGVARGYPEASEDELLAHVLREVVRSVEGHQTGAKHQRFRVVRVAWQDGAGGAGPEAEAEPVAAPDRSACGGPHRRVVLSPEWRTDTTVALARQMHNSGDFSAMPILADALQDAGCDNADILDHCRGTDPHVRGCWVVDLVLGKK